MLYMCAITNSLSEMTRNKSKKTTKNYSHDCEVQFKFLHNSSLLNNDLEVPSSALHFISQMIQQHSTRILIKEKNKLNVANT